jgi:hypothetical protein
MTNEWISRLMTRELATLSRELELFPDEAQIWATAPGIANSVGTLTLHLCGNLQHFVGAVLGKTGYVRDRPREFSARDLPRSVLLENVAATSEVVGTVLAGLTEESLRADYPDGLGVPRMATGLFLYHLSVHLGFHLGQAGYLRRLLTGAGESSGALAMQALAAD